MIEAIRAAHDAEAFYETLKTYVFVVRNHASLQEEMPSDRISKLLPDADARHLEIINILITSSRIEKGQLLTFLETASKLSSG